MTSTYLNPFAVLLQEFLNLQWSALVLNSLSTVLFLILILSLFYAVRFLSRRFYSRIQFRVGPNRASKSGLSQSFLNIIKQAAKESFPSKNDGLFFSNGPVIALALLLAAFGLIPFSEKIVLAAPGLGWLVLMTLIFLIQLVLWWAAADVGEGKTNLLTNRMFFHFSIYSLVLVFAVLPPTLLAGSANLVEIVRFQGGAPWQWTVFKNPGCFFSFIALLGAQLVWFGGQPISVLDLDGFDLKQSYGGLNRFFLDVLDQGSFVLGLSLTVTLYLGGGKYPFSLDFFGGAQYFMEAILFSIKVISLAFFFLWIKASFPRLNSSQTVGFSWKMLVPTGLLGLGITVIWMAANV